VFRQEWENTADLLVYRNIKLMTLDRGCKGSRLASVTAPNSGSAPVGWPSDSRNAKGNPMGPRVTASHFGTGVSPAVSPSILEAAISCFLLYSIFVRPAGKPR
jgi:hypothetical protein